MWALLDHAVSSEGRRQCNPFILDNTIHIITANRKMPKFMIPCMIYIIMQVVFNWQFAILMASDSSIQTV